MSSLTAPIFGGDVVQCQDVVVSWTGGEYPVRVEAFYQPDSTSDWKIAGLPSEAADSNVIRWQANVPAGTYAWITIIDHTGTYRQSPQGVLVQPSDDDSCLAPDSDATVVTQTVFMSGDGQGSEAHLGNGLDDKALLILSICFGILAFAGLAIAVLLFSKLRQARRARMRGPRFSLVDDDWQHGQGFKYGRRGSIENMISGNSATASAFGAGVAAFAGKKSKDSDPNEKARGARTVSAINTFEKSPLSPDTLLGEHNPFLDPPLSAGSTSTSAPFGTYSDMNIRRGSADADLTPTLPSGAFLRRPDMQDRNRSRADTVNSATSIQYLFDRRGELRVANDPTQIETPVMSREVTRSSLSSRYSASTHEHAATEASPSLQRQNSADRASERSSSISSSDNALPTRQDSGDNNANSNDGHSLLSSRSVRTDTTADHYTSEPHSSRGWLQASGDAKK
ncbi:hypothetical protein P389DRAFT_72819 [Cystobasidium minutum MCA 4210]|uniref:uncharacterized protein n=1 Tax=Cystobasidium minutum MCA 4210 TaxID=1397322 RepID=UPI0034CD8874|eukprot:jgi/Rhomi1/72819/CE72818_2121